MRMRSPRSINKEFLTDDRCNPRKRQRHSIVAACTAHMEQRLGRIVVPCDLVFWNIFAWGELIAGDI
jgi:hypothetical protein